MKIATDALLLRRAERGEADLILTFFTEQHGRVTTIAYSAKRSKRRFAVLEPFHTMRVEADNGAREMAVLQHATVTVPRLGFLRDLDRMTAAGKALGWIFKACPERVPEPDLWAAIVAFLETAQTCGLADLDAETAAFGIKMLKVLGWAPVEGSLFTGMSARAALRVVDETVRELRPDAERPAHPVQ